MAHPGKVRVHRDSSGCYYDGESYALRLQSISGWRDETDPTIRVDLFALPNMTGLTRPVLLGRPGSASDFRREEITIEPGESGDEFRCMRRMIANNRDLTCREGIAITLERGIGDLLIDDLHRVDCTSRIAATLRNTLTPTLGRALWPHEDETLLSVASNMLDGHSMLDAMQRAVSRQYGPLFSSAGDHPLARELGEALRNQEGTVSGATIVRVPTGSASSLDQHVAVAACQRPYADG
ncbi:hypothetical protein [Burkholderia cepacia]|nr:hypothetical protein [Burkholderia cepacia]